MCQNKSQAKDCLRGHKANIKKQVRRNRIQAKIQPFAAETSTTKSANDIPCSHKERCENLSIYIRSLLLGDGSWEETKHTFILHWLNQVRKFKDSGPVANHFLMQNYGS